MHVQGWQVLVAVVLGVAGAVVTWVLPAQVRRALEWFDAALDDFEPYDRVDTAD